MTEPTNGLTYAGAGVDIDAGDELIERIKPFAAATRQHIEAALSRCHGRVEGPFGAARLLQMRHAPGRGARIAITKRIPVAAGLAGDSVRDLKTNLAEAAFLGGPFY